MGWVVIVIPLLICFVLVKPLYWLLNQPCLYVVHRWHVQAGYIYLGEGKKFYVLTKHVEKNTFLFSLGIFQWLIKSRGVNGLGIYSDSISYSFYCTVLVTEPFHCVLVTEPCMCCAQVTCAGWVYIFGGRVKNYMF